MQEVPRMGAINGEGDENSEYTNHAYNQKNCYFVFEACYNEASLFSTTLWKSHFCVDCINTYDSEQCYASFDLKNCHTCMHSQQLIDCSYCFYCIDCIHARNCFGSSNIHNKEYVIYNQQVTKQEFEDFMKTKPKFDPTKVPHRIVKHLDIVNCEDVL